MKNYFIKQWEEVCAVEESSELYRIFMRVVQFVGYVGLAYQLVMLPYMLNIVRYSPELGLSMLVMPLLFTLGMILVSKRADRAIVAGKFYGTAIGLVLSLICVPHWYLPLGIFGFYCFLNPAYQKKYLGNAPKPFVDFLSLLQINYTGQKAGAEEVPAPEKI